MNKKFKNHLGLLFSCYCILQHHTSLHIVFESSCLRVPKSPINQHFVRYCVMQKRFHGATADRLTTFTVSREDYVIRIT